MSTVQLTCLLDGHTLNHAYSAAFPLDLTIGDLLDCVENYHDRSECACQTTPGDIAWLVNMTTLPKRKLHFTPPAPQSAKHYQRSDLVCSVLPFTESKAALHLVIENKPRLGPHTPTEFFRSHQVGSAVAHKCGPFNGYRIQSDEETDFCRMRSTPGALIVDKTSFAPPMKLHSSRRNVVIRRPPGFGKTALLSMLEAYVNLEDEIDDDFFSTVDLKSIEIPTSLRDVDGRRGLLVISLDLSKLILSDGDSEEAILDHCNAFMDRELCRTAARYHGLLHPLYGPNLDEIDSAWAFMNRLLRLRICVMITVDNYTAPFEGLSAERSALIESVTYDRIIERLFYLMDCDLLWRSYFFGRDLPTDEPLPWFNQRQFRELTEDLTESTAADAAFGFCSSEIRALWRVAFPHLDMPDPLHLVDPTSTEGDGRRYNIRDILDILDDLRSCSSDEERLTYQPNSRATFITLQPEYTLHLSNSSAPIVLARADDEPTEWATEYVPPWRASEEPNPEPLAEHNAMLAARDEAILRHMQDPTVKVLGVYQPECQCDHHSQAVTENGL